MTLAIGWKTSSGGAEARPRAGFTLMELLLVMLLLAVVLAYAAPALSRFTSRRTLEDEAARLLAVIRYTQTEAVTSGQARAVWIDPRRQRYGIEPLPGLGRVLAGSVKGNPSGDRFTEHRLHRDLVLRTDDGLTGGLTGGVEPVARMVFLPDGTVEAGAPTVLVLEDAPTDRERGGRLYVTRTENGLSYEILKEPDYAMRLEAMRRPTDYPRR